jgi:hypothetical protein
MLTIFCQSMLRLQVLKVKKQKLQYQEHSKPVSTRMTNDRQRTASRGEAIVRREAKKRSGTNLG